VDSFSSFSSSTRPQPASAQNTQPASRRVAIAGVTAEAGGLQVAEAVGAAVVAGHDGVHLQGPLVLVRAAALAAAPDSGEHPVFHGAPDRGAVAAAVGEHLLAGLVAEGLEVLPAERQQLVALGVAQLVAAHQGVAALLARCQLRRRAAYLLVAERLRPHGAPRRPLCDRRSRVHR